VAIGDPLDSAGNVVAPFTGIIGALDIWPTMGSRDIFYLVAVAIAILASVVVIARGTSLWRWLVVPWLLIAILSADLVWNVGNNAIRAFAPLLTLGFLGLLALKGPSAGSAQRSAAAS
jgi:hypothetical protein